MAKQCFANYYRTGDGVIRISPVQFFRKELKKMTEISKDKVVQKLAEMFEEEWYTNKSEYQDDDGNETKEFKELQEIETVVNKMILKYYD